MPNIVILNYDGKNLKCKHVTIPTKKESEPSLTD